MIALDVMDANDQLIECELDGRAYYVGVSWNQAGQFWTLSVRDLDGEVLISAVAVVPLFPLLRQVRRPGMPPGEIGVYSAPGAVLDRQSFVNRTASLWYVGREDLEQITPAPKLPAVAARGPDPTRPATWQCPQDLCSRLK